MVAILLLAAALLFYNLADWPALHIDEAVPGNRAIALGNGDLRDLLAPDPAHYTRAALLLQAIVFKLSGVGQWQLRLASAAFGLLAVAATFSLGRMLFGRAAGVAAASLVAAAHLAIAFGRLGMLNSQALALTTLAFAAIWWAYHRPTPVRWAAAGAVLSSGIYSYTGFAVVPLVAAALLAASAVFNRPFLHRRWRDLAIAFAIFAAMALPLAVSAATSPGGLGAAGGEVTLVGRPDIFYGCYGTTDLTYIVGHQLARSLSLFVTGGDGSTQYGYKGPGLDPATRVLAVAGLLIALVRFRDARYLCLLLWFWSVILLGGVLTESPPLAPRLVMAVPALCLMAGSAAAELYRVARRLLPLPLVAIAAMAVAGYSLQHNTDAYFRAYSVADVY